MKEKIGKVSFNLDYYEGQDLYNDGDVEEELLQIVKEHGREEFPKIIKESGSWPYLYHLSPARANIIDWYPMKEKASILEIGAGCGAITGALVSKGERIVANDLSKRRSMINAYRNQDAQNLELVVGNFNTVAEKLKEKFDYITLIGVFEYAQCYIPGEDPWSAFLNKINGLLADDGEILMAIENRFGMKYFAGCLEDHVGRAFEGIEGYPGNAGVTTFTKGQLEKLFRKNDFTDFTFYYPYPDYKFANVIYSDEHLPGMRELLDHDRNFDMDRYTFFDETKAYDSVIDSGYFPIFSNSFFISIRKKGES